MRSWLSSHFPGAFHALPAVLRRALTWKHLGPAGGTPLEGRVKGKLPILTGWNIASAQLVAGSALTERRLHLRLVNAQQETRELFTSHIIAGTGFRVDMARLEFLDKRLRGELRLQKTGAPVLNRYFQGSVRGLYFIGSAAAASFGPLLRFAIGSEYAATRLAEHLEWEYARQRTCAGGPLGLQLPAGSGTTRLL